ncbi:MAG: protein-L-isoaspartate(D-aspartate) O-methyltransferase [Bdellovibrionales bacterium]|nr:protein-L-isoaspartate(D-aspartate) O-methyltransferase [Bdellovibrionales bacterium]
MNDIERYKSAREAMVNSYIRGVIRDEHVINAMDKVPRHEFVEDQWRAYAYENRPLPIGSDQTISQPFIVATMTEALKIRPGDRVLEVGTGSGYQAAVLCELGADVYSLEIKPNLAISAKKNLERSGYPEVHVKCADGYSGWEEEAPFDKIIITAAPPTVPRELVHQLGPHGRLVLPLGERNQELMLFYKSKDGLHSEELAEVRFVPMTGKIQEESK